MKVAEVRLRGHRISSTMIRRLAQGRPSQPLRAACWGAHTGIEGVVTQGRGVGKQLLYPTANLEIENRVLPDRWCLRHLTLIDGVWRRSVTNIGKRPTFGGDPESKVEAHIIDFDEDLYGRTIRRAGAASAARGAKVQRH
jgi:riboflavin kinase/FMN adenylyltransferase